MTTWPWRRRSRPRSVPDPAALDDVRAVLVNVDGETKIAHYRHGFTENDYLHVWSVTKSVVSILIGIAIADGLITGLDQPLSELLPDHRKAMSDATAQTTLRQLMTMSGGFDDYWPAGEVWESAPADEAFVDLLLERPQYPPGSAFWYSNPSAHLVAAVLAAGLERRPATGRARFSTLPGKSSSIRWASPLVEAFSGPLPDFFTPEFTKAGFGWGTDPDGIQIGGFGLRLRAPDLMKIGELYRQGGVWNGLQIVPAEWIQEFTAPSPSRRDDYGLLWWIIDEPEGAGYLAAGTAGNRSPCWAKRARSIVYLSATPSAGSMADKAISIPSITCSTQPSCDEGAGSFRSPCAFRFPSSISPPIAPGETAQSSIATSVAVARRAEEYGYQRVWYAEHHNMKHIASSATSVLIAHIGAHTSSIRLGAGGVMLPNHSPLVIAEQFGTLDAMYPGRIDLGLGRAPGSDQNTMYALRRDPKSADLFPHDVQELQGYLQGESRVPGVDAVPGKGSGVPLLHPRSCRCSAPDWPRRLGSRTPSPATSRRRP